MNLIPITWSGYALALTGPEYCDFFLNPITSVEEGVYEAELVIVSKDDSSQVTIPLQGTMPTEWITDQGKDVSIEFENNGSCDWLHAPIWLRVSDDSNKLNHELESDNQVTLATFAGLFAYCPIEDNELDEKTTDPWESEGRAGGGSRG